MYLSQRMGPILNSLNLKNKILKSWGKSAFGGFVSTSPKALQKNPYESLPKMGCIGFSKFFLIAYGRN